MFLKIGRPVAAAVAFLFAGAALLSALFGSVVLLLFVPVPVLAGIGILRRRAWSAYGYGLCLAGQAIPSCAIASRTPSLWPGIVSALGITLIVSAFFFLIGRAMAQSGAAPGRALPWIVVAALMNLPMLFVEAFIMPSASMEDTLLLGDKVVVRCFPTPSVSRGDIVVFTYPLNPKEAYIKRVIGLPGDRIRLVDRVVYRNGIALREPYVKHVTTFVDAYRDNFPSNPGLELKPPAKEMLEKNLVNGEVIVPPGNYFVLGDNRDDSLDSRYLGFVHFGNLIGKPILIYDSEEVPPTETSNDKSPHRPHTRWNRIFTRPWN